MRNLKLILFTLLVLFIPLFVNAKSDYIDKVYDIVGENKSDVVTIYFFHQSTCSHCRKENEFLDTLEEKYEGKINIKRYEVLSSKTNSNYLVSVKKRFNVNDNYVPFTVIGEKTYVGFSDAISSSIENDVIYYLDNNIKDGKDENLIKLPLLGEINPKKASIPIIAIILGIIDGFNPCALWVLLFLINMLFNMKNKKRMWILGIAFLFTSAFIYFLAMLGLSVVLSFTTIIWVRILIALVAIIGGIINLKSYLEAPKDGCKVVDEKKRKKYFSKIKKFTTEKSLILSLVGVITLAASVNLVELACSAGFPTIFISILELNNVSTISTILYIMLYILFYLIDDLVIFIVAMLTLQITGITTKYNKIAHLVGGLIMIFIGLLLIFKPEWIMFNF